ncbi:MAG: DinB family protein [Armatimonadetes bacterium]|nr:DinB family protein [Armatimonadota bacterium]
MFTYFYSAPALTLDSIEHLIGLIPTGRHDERLNADRFTVREIIAHLADFEPIFRSRIQHAIDQPGYVITPVDEDLRAREMNYAGLPVAGSLAKFKHERLETIALIEKMPEEVLRNPVRHPQYGEVTVADLVWLLAAHDSYHVQQLVLYIAPKTAATW